MNERLKLPDGWKECNLGEIGNVSMCKRIFKSQTSVMGDIPFYKIGTFGKNPDAYISSELYDEYRKKFSFPRKGDILLSASGTIGRKVVYDGSPSYFQDSNIIWIDNCEDRVLNKFLYYFYEMVKWRTTEGATIARLYNDNLKKIKILFPPLTEQKAIADILQTWDTAIEKTEALIAAKEKQFDWLVHNLIIKNRGRGISSEWHKTHLGNICSVRTGQSAPQDETLFSPKGIPFIRVSSLDYLLGKSNSKKIEYVSEETGEKLNFQLFDEGTLVFAKSGMSALQSRIHKLSEPSFIVSHLCALTPKNSITGNYLEYYLKSYHPNQLIQGDGFPSIRTSEISSFPIWLPSLPEQKCIAESLNTAKREIDTLKTLADRYRTQKRGLMQKLLTGKWRVKI